MSNGIRDPAFRGLLDVPAEGRLIDYKQGCRWTDLAAGEKAELCRDIAALANAGGGYLIMGYSNSPLAPDGKVPDDHGFDVTVVGDLVNSRFAPPISFQIYADERSAGKRVIVIAVQSFEAQPHICTKGSAPLRQAAIYYRTAEAKTQEIQNPDDMRRLITEAARRMRALAEYVVGAKPEGRPARAESFFEEALSEGNRLISLDDANDS